MLPRIKEPSNLCSGCGQQFLQLKKCAGCKQVEWSAGCIRSCCPCHCARGDRKPAGVQFPAVPQLATLRCGCPVVASLQAAYCLRECQAGEWGAGTSYSSLQAGAASLRRTPQRCRTPFNMREVDGSNCCTSSLRSSLVVVILLNRLHPTPLRLVQVKHWKESGTRRSARRWRQPGAAAARTEQHGGRAAAQKRLVPRQRAAAFPGRLV